MPPIDFKAFKVLSMLCASGRLCLWECHHSSFPAQTVLELGNSMLKGFWGDQTICSGELSGACLKQADKKAEAHLQGLEVDHIGPMDCASVRRKFEKGGADIFVLSDP